MREQKKECCFCKTLDLVPNSKHNPYEIDHILLVLKGGTNDPSNLRWLCRYHNRARRTEETLIFIRGVEDIRFSIERVING